MSAVFDTPTSNAYRYMFLDRRSSMPASQDEIVSEIAMRCGACLQRAALRTTALPARDPDGHMGQCPPRSCTHANVIPPRRLPA